MTPSMAWSNGASSNTMLAALPPSSRVSALPDPAMARPISLPTAVEPVKATLSTSGWDTRARPISPGPVMMFTTPGGKSAWRQTSANSSADRGVADGGLQHHGVPRSERRRDLPGEHQQREVPGNDLGRDAQRLRVTIGKGVLELVCPSRVVPEVGRRERHVHVPRLLDGLAAIEGLQDGELAAAFLEDASDAVQVLGAFPAQHRDPMSSLKARRAAATARSTSRVSAIAIWASGSSVAGSSVVNVLPARGLTSSPR